MGKTSEKVQRTAMHDQKGKTTKRGRTGDTGFATSLRIQEENINVERHQCPKQVADSNPETMQTCLKEQRRVALFHFICFI